MTALRRLAAADVGDHVAEQHAIDTATTARTVRIVADVRDGGRDALFAHRRELDGLTDGQPLIVAGDALTAARDALPAEDRGVLERTAARIDAFARAQRDAIDDVTVDVPGGTAGHRVDPVEHAGCYAPGGRYPLPSSVLMTAVTARAAGVADVTVATPSPEPLMLAAAAVAGADRVLLCGGAHAIAALAHGVECPRADVIVGPGNRWVTAAKRDVAGTVGIDMLAGPSELLVLADDTADPELVAADLLGQAEHDVDARPILVTTDPAMADRVDAALAEQLEALSTAATARESLEAHGLCIVARDLDEAVGISDAFAPEHLEIVTRDAATLLGRLRHYGAAFVGSGSAEVFGDYGIGPNHVLPTGGTARFRGGLSVLTFLRVRTWLHVESPDPALGADVDRLATLERLAAHAASARRRYL